MYISIRKAHDISNDGILKKNGHDTIKNLNPPKQVNPCVSNGQPLKPDNISNVRNLAIQSQGGDMVKDTRVSNGQCMQPWKPDNISNVRNLAIQSQGGVS